MAAPCDAPSSPSAASDILDAHLDRIYEICRGHKPSSPDDPVPLSSFHIGPFLVLRRLWHDLGLPQRLGALADRALVLVLNRLTRPASEHALADWLTAFFACDSQGRRFAPAFLSDAQRAAARNPRVKVQAFQLQRWYRTLDALLPLKDKLEKHLFDRFRHLFALHCDLVFYDLTSTYFEGLGPQDLARHGYSRDHRPANPQILVGVAMVDGLPVSHTVLAGNRKDSTTVQEVIRDLRARFGLGRFVFVGDRGMKSESSVEAVEEAGLGYLMAVQGRRNPVMDAALAAAKPESWVACEGWGGAAEEERLAGAGSDGGSRRGRGASWCIRRSGSGTSGSCGRRSRRRCASAWSGCASGWRAASSCGGRRRSGRGGPGKRAERRPGQAPPAASPPCGEEGSDSRPRRQFAPPAAWEESYPVADWDTLSGSLSPI